MTTFFEWLKIDAELIVLAESFGRYLFEEQTEVDADKLGTAAFWVRQSAMLDRYKKHPKEPGNKPDVPIAQIKKNAAAANRFFKDNIHILISNFVDKIYKGSDEEEKSEIVNSLYVRVWNWLTSRDKSDGGIKGSWSPLPADFAIHIYKAAKNELFKLHRARQRELAPTSPLKGGSTFPRVVTGRSPEYYANVGWSGGKRRSGRYHAAKEDDIEFGKYSDSSATHPMPQSSGIDTKTSSLRGTQLNNDPSHEAMDKERRQQILSALNSLGNLDAHELNSTKVKNFLARHGLTPWQAYALMKQFDVGIDPGSEDWINNRGLSDDNASVLGRKGQFSQIASDKIHDMIGNKLGKSKINPNTVRAMLAQQTPVAHQHLQKQLYNYA